MSSYNTIAKNSYSEFIIKKSRFIGRAFPVSSEKYAIDCISLVKKENRDASHNCYAYVIGRNSDVMRFNDDGEPGGTAGMPMLEVIRANELNDVLVVVTRYFGGILLGSGGLVRAYSKSCADALSEARISTMLQSDKYVLEIAYSDWDRIQARIKNSTFFLESVDYGTNVYVTLWVKTIENLEFYDSVANWSEGSICPKKIGSEFRSWEIANEEE